MHPRTQLATVREQLSHPQKKAGSGNGFARPIENGKAICFNKLKNESGFANSTALSELEGRFRTT
jgi:hypothetical protein